MKLDAASTIEGQLKSGPPEIDDTFFVHIQGKGKGKDGTRVFEISVDEASTGAATVVKVKGPLGDGEASDASRMVTIKDIDWELGEPIFRAAFDGAPRTLQCLGTDTLGCVAFVFVHLHVRGC